MMTEQSHLLKRRMETASAWRGAHGESGNTRKKSVDFDVRFIRRIEKSNGESTKFRGWLFGSVIAIGRADGD